MPSPSHIGSEKLLTWESANDPENPFCWSRRKKWAVTLLASFITFIAGINGTAITAAASAIDSRFHISEAAFPNSYWVVTSWNMGAALAPLVALPLMETFGIRYLYPVIYLLFIIFIAPQAVASNFATLIATRIFSGACAGVLENITGGIISDIWADEHSRSFPMAVYIWGLLAGVSFGPVFGGAIASVASWRWIFYAQLILYGALVPFVVAVPETRGSVILKRRARKLRKLGKDIFAPAELEDTSLAVLARETLIRPLNMLATEWVVFSFTLWSSFSFGTALMFTQSVPQVFISLYSWSEWQTGVLQFAVVIGMSLGLLATIPQNAVYRRSSKQNKEEAGQPIPEARLYLSVIGSFVGLAGGFFLYAWTSYPSLLWIAPTIGLALVGFGIFTIVTAVGHYFTDAYSKYAASSFAAVAFGENVFAAFLPLATKSMYETLGFQWASSLLGFVGLLLSAAPVVLIAYGKEIRSRSPFIAQGGHDSH
jgi:MFS family permease